MTGIHVDLDLLERFERGLDPLHPERSQIPAQVLGYGEISTVLAIGEGDLAYKRMPMFANEGEITAYAAALDAYLARLKDAGLAVTPSTLVPLQQRCGNRRVAYLVEPRLPAHAVGNAVVRTLAPAEAQRLLEAVLGELLKVYRYNRQQAGAWALGIDGQISNWVVEDLPPQGGLPPEVVLHYFDVNTPLVRRNGVELLDTELFLRSAPAFLRWVLRVFFLHDVVDRYYDLRRVVVDLIANLYKEGRADLIPGWLETANRFLAEEAAADGIRAVEAREVSAYYRDDVRIWRLYLGFRRFDRALHRLTGRRYPYVLPGPIRR